jgi:hypothetical protein
VTSTQRGAHMNITVDRSLGADDPPFKGRGLPGNTRFVREARPACASPQSGDVRRISGEHFLYGSWNRRGARRDSRRAASGVHALDRGVAVVDGTADLLSRHFGGGHLERAAPRPTCANPRYHSIPMPSGLWFMAVRLSSAACLAWPCLANLRWKRSGSTYAQGLEPSSLRSEVTRAVARSALFGRLLQQAERQQATLGLYGALAGLECGSGLIEIQACAAAG